MKILVLTKMPISRTAVDAIGLVVPTAEVYYAADGKDVHPLTPRLRIFHPGSPRSADQNV
ncbi:MAG: hypothetical protein ACOX8W_12845 [bacterium]|jgi:hypothetical protein